ncbi:Tim44/TimA family putative adaptor protein [Acetobacter sp. TBRC 12305]|uniref:Tim44 domain-containing protein n=1 Tax=Acetobacter garciniae TaxID=2817435 RepID=A0A939HG85_9PROT|nr:Tim44/TimA family putative adaptor protein [Acetobacter garciniae]MBO1323810.1 Tim44 domain-containing protein [Acetobacter garciniae]MBX0343499.1 Tim44/TimA family putative adaptor protein [Acetobacter garciniae]
MDFSLGHFPVDLVLLALVAAFLALRLRGVLGKRVGMQPQPMPVPPRADAAVRAVESMTAQPEASATTFDIPAPGTRVGQLLVEIRQFDPAFAAQPFLMNVQTVFAQVVKAYADGNRDTLKTYLIPAVYASFDSAMTAREQAGEKQRTEIKAVRSLSIEDVRLTPLATAGVGSMAAIDVRIVSDQVSLVVDAQGQPVTGTDAVTEFSDLWTFERLVGVNGTGWRLAAARSA